MMDGLLSAAEDVHQLYHGIGRTQSWLDYFDNLIEYPAAKIGQNPQVSENQKRQRQILYIINA